LLLQYPLGYLADRMDRMSLLSLCALGGVIGAIATPLLIGVPWAMYLLLAVWGGVVMGIYTIGLTWIGERFKGAQLVGANAANVILYSLGLLLGPAVEGVALDLWNPNGLLVVLGGICAAYFALITVRRLLRAERLALE
jgi:MFS family permease